MAILKKIGRRTRRQKPDLIAGYHQPGWLSRHRKLAIFAIFTILFFYSALFLLIGRFLLVPFMLPIALIFLLIIWALPERDVIPDRLLERLFIAFMVAQLIWPNYLALSISSLPWITAVRLIGLPMALMLLICLSQSQQFRDRMKDVLFTTPTLAKMFLLFIGIALLSLAFSTDRGASANHLIVAMISWFAIFFVALVVFARLENVEKFVWLIWIATIFWIVLGMWEWQTSRVPWAGRVPSFLKVEDEVVQRVLNGTVRAASGIYRVQGKYTTSLGMAEFMAMVTPFLIHFCLSGRTFLIRLAAGLTVPMIFVTIIATDSRLGAVGFFLSLLGYLAIWGIRQWKHKAGSLFGPAVTLGYPVIFMLFIVATFTVGRLRRMVWGTGAQSFSTEAREVQLEMGIQDVLARPWGYGSGRGAEALGFTNQAGVLTIDNYYLSVALEYGVIGFVAYYGMFLIGIVRGARVGIEETDPRRMWVIPAALSLANYFVIKSVFSQQEGHPLAFALLGMIVALIWASPHKNVPTFSGLVSARPNFPTYRAAKDGGGR